MAKKLPTLTIEQCDLVVWLTVKEATEFFGWKDIRTTIKKCKEKKILFIRIGNEYRIPVFKTEYNDFLQKTTANDEEKSEQADDAQEG